MGILSKWIESLGYELEILPTCTRNLSPRSTCEKCIGACGEHAISMENGRPLIDKNKCTDCGNCISTCPEQAIAGIYPKRTIIQNQLVIKEEKIPTIKELLILYKKGIQTIVGETPGLLETWKEPIVEANLLLAKLGEAPFSTEIKSIKEEIVVSRRELFSLWKEESKSAMKQVAPAKWRFNHSDFHLPKYFKDYQFATIRIDSEKCTLCTACQKLCEKKCFNIRDEHMSIFSQNCSSCQLCVDACPEKAIVVEEQISNAEEILLPIYEQECQSCKRPFRTLHEHDSNCVECTKRNFFEK